MENIKPKKAVKAKSQESNYQVIVDTPKGSRNKYEYDEDQQLFKLSGVLTAGAVFPFDFGFLPQTLGEDGDPLDALILMDEPAFVGCLVEVRMIGVLEAEQTEAGKSFRNDRLLAVAIESHSFTDVKTLSELDKALVKQIEHFFISYNQAKGKVFKPLRRSNAARARKLIESGIEKFQSKDA
jgi:inorganic pyrophosphatase